MDFSGLTQFITSQVAGVLTAIVAVLVVSRFAGRDFKGLLIIAIAGGLAYYLVHDTATVFGWISNIANMVKG
ncbi:hypothetical protein WOSG25_050280 [Weissella oryzae SG25]|uniref:Uncharacterized protein n=1 Tax=Weissella oryzae (strain DSM 25784 / JCM 18191 / LMG 30913 / SG25) TaxID=1329250 RepID=A0A069D0B4_WEIOS|nr:hypothetical protein [Weissella oryzae]GAK30756.1 hypothetical protein WOSG25_050280 [Weissella oryzae SG25]